MWEDIKEALKKYSWIKAENVERLLTDAEALQQRVGALERLLNKWRKAHHEPTPSNLGKDYCGLCDLRYETAAVLAATQDNAGEQGEG